LREPAGSIVYRRRQHVINLFVIRHLDAEHGAAKIESVQGFNIRHWTAEVLDFWAVSDINAGELYEFARKFTAALRPLPGPS
jgi:anti-sigma factor RsiW